MIGSTPHVTTTVAGCLTLFLTVGCSPNAPPLDSLGTIRSPFTFTGKHFGVECQQTFENSWNEEVYYAWDRCGGFNDQMSITDYSNFYLDLNGAKPYWEDSNDVYELDSVDMIFANTHGDIWNGSFAQWAMWNEWISAESTSMRLGDDGPGLKIFSAWACKTLEWRDNLLWTRMFPIFAGGLVMATGSQDIVWNGVTTDEVGHDYAVDLQLGYTVKEAWHDVLGDWWYDNDGVVLSSGNATFSCTGRRDSLNWTTSSPWILRDGNIDTMCLSWWFDE